MAIALRRTRLLMHVACSVLVVGVAILLLIAFESTSTAASEPTSGCDDRQREARIALKCVQRRAAELTKTLGRTPRAREVRCEYLRLANNYEVRLASHPSFFVVTALGRPDSDVFGDIWSLDDRAELAHIHDVCN